MGISNVDAGKEKILINNEFWKLNNIEKRKNE